MLAVLVAGYFSFSAWVAPRERPMHGPFADLWQQHRREVLNDPTLERYFSFQDIRSDQDGYSNLAGWGRNLAVTRDPSNVVVAAIKSVEGRWPWKRAVQVDQLPLESTPFNASAKAFTVAAWIRHHGQGMVPGGNYETAGTLLAVGDGVWSGWRLTMYYPCNVMAFEIGRPKPQQSVGVTALSRVPPEVWTHVACSWDGQQISMYVNGVLSASVPYSGEFYPAKSHSKLRIGYVGNGLGSVRFDIDEFATWERCLSPSEVLRNAWFQHPVSDEIATKFQSAGASLISRKLSEAIQTYSKLAEDRSLSQELKALARMRIGECQREQQEYDLAMLQFSQVASDEGASDSCRRAALLESLALTEGLKLSKDLAPAAAVGQIDPYHFCQLTSEYERAMDAYHHLRSVDDGERWKRRYEQDVQPVLQRHCIACHDAVRMEGGLDLTHYSSGDAASEVGEVWMKVAAAIQSGRMPPSGHAQVPIDEKESVQHWAESRPRYAFCEELATEENQRYFAGHVFSRRLTRLEYGNSIHDLFGVTLQAEELPPQDGSGGEGFDTVGDVLFTSTAHLEAYLRSAKVAVERSLGHDLKDPVGTPGRLLIALPASLDPLSGLTEADAAARILTAFSRRAWRRSVEPKEITELLELFQKERTAGQDFRTAIAAPLMAVTLSPHFLFVVETEPDGAGVQRLTPHQLATRLSLFLWSSIPDDELLDAADSGKIYDDQFLRRQVRRMLRDPKSRALGESFGLQWLGIQEDGERAPDPDVFPEFTPDLASDEREEVIRFVSWIFQENRPLTELIDANYVLVNGRLGQHYGLQLPPNAPWQMTPVNDRRRGGVLTMGGVLTVSSFARRTSPVLRGKWIMDQVLGSYVAPPPPNVPALDDSSTADQPMTMRHRLEKHRAQAECAACHQTMDPLGFSLENYDAIGRWRETDEGLPVDAIGTLPSGDLVSGPDGLKKALLARSDEFQRHFVRKLIGFAVGRGLDRFDDCLVDKCLKHLKDSGSGAGTLVEEIARSYAFQYRYYKPTQ